MGDRFQRGWPYSGRCHQEQKSCQNAHVATPDEHPQADAAVLWLHERADDGADRISRSEAVEAIRESNDRTLQ